MSQKAVIAIGGNSLIPDADHVTVQDQYRAAGETDDAGMPYNQY